MTSTDRFLLRASVAVPVAYFGTLLLGAARDPAYSHMRQMVSELGMDGSPARMIFAVGIFLAGLCAVAAGLGFWRALSGLRHPMLGAMTGIFLALFGLAFLVGAVFPLPDPRHAAFGLGLAVHLAPVSLLLALRREAGLVVLKSYLALSIVLMTTLLVAMMGVGDLVSDGNLGLAQRLYALAAFPWIGLAGHALLRHVSPQPPATAPTVIQPAV